MEKHEEQALLIIAEAQQRGILHPEMAAAYTGIWSKLSRAEKDQLISDLLDLL